MTKNDLMKLKRYNEFVSFISDLGYVETSGSKGSHRIFKADNKPTLSIPNHNGGKGEIPPGTRRNLVKLILNIG